jgi:hypothetical protein
MSFTTSSNGLASSFLSSAFFASAFLAGLDFCVAAFGD